MGKFKGVHFIATALLIVLLIGCGKPSPHMVDPSQIDDHMDHAACDSEKTAGGCALSEGDSNADLFGKSYEGIVKTSKITTDSVSGFLAVPEKEGTYPGVVMIHEWWGLNDNIEEMAQLLSSEGYVVFAIDLYGEVATTPERARTLMADASADQEKTNTKMRAAVAYLRSLPEVRDSKIGSIGWCFGGGQSLQLALSGEKMDATIIYYGRVTNDTEKLDMINWPVLGLFAGEDQGISADSVRSFESAINSLGIKNEIVIYPGVGHAFANPSGAAYAENETRDAWGRSVEFFDENLR